MAKGTLLDRCVAVPLGAPLAGGIVGAMGGEMSLLDVIFLRRQRKNSRISKRMTVKPATPPTTPPTTDAVDTLPVAPDPFPGLAVDEGAVPVGLLVAPPIPPGTAPILEVALVKLDDDKVEDCEELDEVLVVDEELVLVEVIWELVVESVVSPLLDGEEIVVDVSRVEFETGVAKVRLVGPLDPVLVCEDCEDVEARRRVNVDLA